MPMEENTSVNGRMASGTGDKNDCVKYVSYDDFIGADKQAALGALGIAYQSPRDSGVFSEQITYDI